MEKVLASLMPAIAVMLIFACSDSDNGDQVVVDVAVHLTIEDATGNDLLDPLGEGAIDPGDIHVYYEVNGSKVSFESTNDGAQLDYPKGFYMGSSDGTNVFDGKHVLTVFSNPAAGDEVITIIEIDGHEEITLSTKVSRKNGNTIVQRISYKGNVVWSMDGDIPKYVKVVY